MSWHPSPKHRMVHIIESRSKRSTTILWQVLYLARACAPLLRAVLWSNVGSVLLHWLLGRAGDGLHCLQESPRGTQSVHENAPAGATHCRGSPLCLQRLLQLCDV
mmetsp:Transcript_21271/g.50060  ORF Transcript_21271/g.50060 Transcript_21271/m.50060 type:complete len:105 (+) Transcript_21271:1301-1615(+)